MSPAVGDHLHVAVPQWFAAFHHDLTVHLVHGVPASITCMNLLVQYSRASRHAEVKDLVDLILD
eukprot:9171605-Heterocapsa_arctica.AAC.1